LRWGDEHADPFLGTGALSGTVIHCTVVGTDIHCTDIHRAVIGGGPRSGIRREVRRQSGCVPMMIGQLDRLFGIPVLARHCCQQ
jgi:hypothetical protein